MVVRKRIFERSLHLPSDIENNVCTVDLDPFCLNFLNNIIEGRSGVVCRIETIIYYYIYYDNLCVIPDSGVLGLDFHVHGLFFCTWQNTR